MARPKRAAAATAAAEAPKEEPNAQAADATPVKRGRGRPPKNGVSKVVKPPSGRPRGRPRLDPSQRKTPVAKAKPKAAAASSTPGKRGPGRPRKSDAAATPTATPAKTKGSTPAKGGPKRGRPSAASIAAAAAAADQEEDEEAESEKGQGGSGSEGSDVEDEPMEDADEDPASGKDEPTEHGPAGEGTTTKDGGAYFFSSLVGRLSGR